MKIYIVYNDDKIEYTYLMHTCLKVFLYVCHQDGTLCLDIFSVSLQLSEVNMMKK